MGSPSGLLGFETACLPESSPTVSCNSPRSPSSRLDTLSFHLCTELLHFTKGEAPGLPGGPGSGVLLCGPRGALAGGSQVRGATGTVAAWLCWARAGSALEALPHERTAGLSGHTLAGDASALRSLPGFGPDRHRLDNPRTDAETARSCSPIGCPDLLICIAGCPLYLISSFSFRAQNLGSPRGAFSDSPDEVGLPSSKTSMAHPCSHCHSCHCKQP